MRLSHVGVDVRHAHSAVSSLPLTHATDPMDCVVVPSSLLRLCLSHLSPPEASCLWVVPPSV